MATVNPDIELEERLRRPARGEPVWPLADQFPHQGEWTEDSYLSLETNQLIEFVDGCLEFLPVPTDSHQAISDFLLDVLKAYVRPRKLGTIRYGPLRLRVGSKYREPDLLFLRAERDHLRHDRYWESADLVVEIVSPKQPDRDWETKRAEYAATGIPEYWIADPRDNSLTVFTLDAGATEYREAGRYQEGETAASVLLDGLNIDVSAIFASE